MDNITELSLNLRNIPSKFDILKNDKWHVTLWNGNSFGIGSSEKSFAAAYAVAERNLETGVGGVCPSCNKPHEKTYGDNNEWCENCVPY